MEAFETERQEAAEVRADMRRRYAMFRTGPMVVQVQAGEDMTVPEEYRSYFERYRAGEFTVRAMEYMCRDYFGPGTRMTPEAAVAAEAERAEMYRAWGESFQAYVAANPTVTFPTPSGFVGAEEAARAAGGRVCVAA